MTHRSIEPAQHTAAKLAGVLFVFGNAIAVFAEFYARGRLIVAGDAAQTARNIVASERLFRIGTVGDLIVFVGDAILVWALYVVLNPVNRNITILATILRVVETAILAVITLNDFVVLRLLSDVSYLRVFDTQQLQALARVFVGVQGDGYRIGLVFFGLGSIVFAYLWFKSRYIPRGLAAFGIFSSSLVTIVTLALMVFPGVSAIVNPAYYAPIIIFEVTLGFWLLVKGIHAPVIE